MSAIFKSNRVTSAQISDATAAGRAILQASGALGENTGGPVVLEFSSSAYTATFSEGADGTGSNVNVSNGVVTSFL